MERAPAHCRGVAQLARAPVSKTGGWGFETLHPCQFNGPGLKIGAQDLGIGIWPAIIEGFDERGVPTGEIRA
jgi:hypothetical protein